MSKNFVYYIKISNTKLSEPLLKNFIHEQQMGTVGAVVVFSGIMRRSTDKGEIIDHMVIEHYPTMTEKKLQQILKAAGKKFNLTAGGIMHRIGKILPDDTIVLVATAAAHRKNAYLANQYIMDYCKTEAPFWKKEVLKNPSHQKKLWVKQKLLDLKEITQWKK